MVLTQILQSRVFDFPLIGPYKVLFFSIFGQKGLIFHRKGFSIGKLVHLNYLNLKYIAILV